MSRLFKAVLELHRRATAANEALSRCSAIPTSQKPATVHGIIASLGLSIEDASNGDSGPSECATCGRDLMPLSELSACKKMSVSPLFNLHGVASNEAADADMEVPVEGPVVDGSCSSSSDSLYPAIYGTTSGLMETRTSRLIWGRSSVSAPSTWRLFFHTPRRQKIRLRQLSSTM